LSLTFRPLMQRTRIWRMSKWRDESRCFCNWSVFFLLKLQLPYFALF
jgi:hypothetical protein